MLVQPTEISSLIFPLSELDASILLGAAWFDEQQFDFQSAQPSAHFLRSEL